MTSTTTHPSYDQLKDLPAYAEQPVPIAFEDNNGHLNVRHYLGIGSEGLDESLVDLGIPVDWPIKAGHACFAAEHHVTYLRELRTGDRMSVRVRLLGRSERAEEIFLHIDISDRRTAPWPADVAEAIDARVAEHEKLPFEAVTSGSMALR